MATDNIRGNPSRPQEQSRITPDQALENTRGLLREKQEKDEAPKAWHEAGGAPPEGEPGYQSHAAAQRAQELHEGEVRLQANGGSIATHDRKHQAKRDKRN
ncbi:MAG: hypothetical protein M3Q40_10815 [Pseudomonadota bacterium]|nr:hypothetical protein [Pseudomonadota bacterium]